LPRRASAYLTTLRSLMRGLGCDLLEPIQATQGSCCCWREEAWSVHQIQDEAQRSKLIAKFYKSVGRPLDPDNMLWPVIKRFLKRGRR
jgi:hypothetical protein